MQNPSIRIATRQSPLALIQTNLIKQALLFHYPDLIIEVIGFTTSGDKNLSVPLTEIGGKGLFTKELEQALLSHEADIAVHSVKDLTVVLPEGLILAAVTEREDARDVLSTHKACDLRSLPHGASVGSSSLRRQCQLLAARPDLHIKPLRGNIQTRLSKLKHGEYDALVLASAGLKRLNLSDQITYYFSLAEILPAIGQGALGIQCRQEDIAIQRLLSPLNHPPTYHAILAERAFNSYLNGGCRSPIAAFATFNQGHVSIEGLVGSPDGKTIIRASLTGASPEETGIVLAQQLLSQGADKILRSCS